MANRLSSSASDYLRMHAHQPIHWQEWGDEALAEAQQRDVPVLLSIGYASCHWCHVMSEETFDDPEIAERVNEHFVAVKVDRAQLPDVDAAFMTATQAMNGGAGGWPMTLFLTPDGRPYFAGTYFPPEPANGQPSFTQVLDAMIGGWKRQRQQVLSNAGYISRLLETVTIDETDDAPDLRAAIDAVESRFDLVHGGFGDAPKFPAPTLLDALLVKGDPRSLEIAQRTLESMARGGIHDQVAGGFHRYSVDAGWVVPHFEKMLYDNALLLGTYVRAWRRTADHDAGLRALFERTAYGIVEFVERELTGPHGEFYAGLDADSTDIRGSVHEGIFYVWSPDLLEDALGAEDAEWASEVFHVTRGGTFEHGLSTLQLRGRPDWARLDRVRDSLLAERANRFRPATDRIIVAAWNGWMISALVQGAMIFNEPKWLDMAERAAGHLVDVHIDGGELKRSSYDGEASRHDGSADDYGAVAEAFARLAGAIGEPGWLRKAEEIVVAGVAKFGADDGGFFDGVDTGLFRRPRSLTDNVTPSGTSSMIQALRLVGLLGEREDLVTRADEASRTTWGVVTEHPEFAGSALADLLIADEARRGLKPAVVVVVSEDPFDELARASWRMAPAGSAVLTAPASMEGFGTHLDGRDHRSVWVCRGNVCFDPVDDYMELKTPLWSRV